MRETLLPGQGNPTLILSGVDERRAYGVVSPQAVQYLSGIVPREDFRRRMYGKEIIGNLGSPIVSIHASVDPAVVYVQTRDGFRLIRTDEPYDVHADDFLFRANIVDPVQRLAVITLVKELKSKLLWSKFKAIYPYVGARATSHAQNLVNNLYTITWNGGLTHNANGVTGNGTTGYGNTGLKPSDIGVNGGITAYMRVLPTGDNNATGLNNGVDAYYQITTNITSVQRYGLYGSLLFAIDSVVPTVGMCSINRTSANSLVFYHNGMSVASNSSTSTTAALAQNLFVLATNFGGSPFSFSEQNDALVAFHLGLSGPESMDFYNIVQAFQTSLGRQI